MRLAIGTLFALAILTPSLGAQQTATICKDGSTSAASGRGACSDHGGVDKKATSEAKKTAKAEAKAVVKDAKASGTMVVCTDGSESNPGRGACSHHGGVRVAGAAAVPATQTRTPAQVSPRVSVPVAASPRVSTPAPAPAVSSPTTTTAAAASRRGEDNDPSGAIAQCKDGLYSHAANRRGACSRHQGVAKWMP
jgi:hypothetical protein